MVFSCVVSFLPHFRIQAHPKQQACVVQALAIPWCMPSWSGTTTVLAGTSPPQHLLGKWGWSNPARPTSPGLGEPEVGPGPERTNLESAASRTPGHDGQPEAPASAFKVRWVLAAGPKWGQPWGRSNPSTYLESEVGSNLPSPHPSPTPIPTPRPIRDCARDVPVFNSAFLFAITFFC